NQYFMNVVFQKVGWDPIKGEKSTYALLRSSLISSLVKLDDKEILEEAKLRFSNLLRTDLLNPDLRSVVYSAIAWTGNSNTYQQLISLYRKASTQEEKVRFLGSLSNFKEAKLLDKTFAFALSKDVRTQSLFVPISKMVANPNGKDLVWPWIQKNWKGLVKRFGVGNPLLNKVIGSVSVMADLKHEKEIRSFFTKHHIPGTEMKLAQSLERIRIHAKFLENARKEFGQ
ncbi:MAG: ERAP1-like C-terminal domain-containing protein, partial [Thaumarchaeota archaeon]|nr:ERAP1-like C-terminal domain-containing protein [Nitrososphaerota archaeon]